MEQLNLFDCLDELPEPMSSVGSVPKGGAPTLDERPEPRPYQQRVVSAVDAAFCEGARRVLVVAPTGAGKTVMGFQSAERLLQESERWFGKARDAVTVGWMAMRPNLVAQALAVNDRWFRIPNLTGISVLSRRAPKVDLLISDECHHDASNSSITIYGLTNPRLTIGLSATPLRADKMRLCFDRTVRDADYYRLIDEGYLSSFHHYTVDSWSPQVVADTYLREPERWGMSIVFMRTIRDCRAVVERLQAGGIRAEVVTASTDRYDQMDRLASGGLDVLVNVGVLTEGVDIPALATVFVRDASRGPTIQMAGRVLRRHGDDVAAIVQSKFTKWPFLRSANARCRYAWQNGAWASNDGNDNAYAMERMALQRLADVDVTLPAWITKHRRTEGWQKLVAKGKADAEAADAASEAAA